MNRENAKATLLEFFSDLIIITAKQRGYKGQLQELERLCNEMLPPYVESILNRYTPSPMSITEQMAADLLQPPRRDAGERLVMIVNWVVDKYGTENIPSSSQIERLVHLEISKQSKVGILLSEGFFPFGKYEA